MKKNGEDLNDEKINTHLKSIRGKFVGDIQEHNRRRAAIIFTTIMLVLFFVFAALTYIALRYFFWCLKVFCKRKTL